MKGKNFPAIITSAAGIRAIGIWAFTLLLVGFFINVSYRKFSGNVVTVGHFRDWGYGAWLIKFTASLELTGAILLLFPVTATSGALLLSLVMAGATYTLIGHEIWSTAAITLTTLILLLIFGYLRWNQSWILMIFKLPNEVH